MADQQLPYVWLVAVPVILTSVVALSCCAKKKNKVEELEIIRAEVKAEKELRQEQAAVNRKKYHEILKEKALLASKLGARSSTFKRPATAPPTNIEYHIYMMDGQRGQPPGPPGYQPPGHPVYQPPGHPGYYPPGQPGYQTQGQPPYYYPPMLPELPDGRDGTILPASTPNALYKPWGNEEQKLADDQQATGKIKAAPLLGDDSVLQEAAAAKATPLGERMKELIVLEAEIEDEYYGILLQQNEYDAAGQQTEGAKILGGTRDPSKIAFLR